MMATEPILPINTDLSDPMADENTNIPTNGVDPTETEGVQSLQDQLGITIDDLELSSNVVYRIVKEMLPENVRMQKDPKLALAQSATVFVSYLAAAAQDLATADKRKLVNINDITKALQDLEFSEFVNPIQTFIEGVRLESDAKKAKVAVSEPKSN